MPTTRVGMAPWLVLERHAHDTRGHGTVRL
jgi:hypothetical protein